MSFFKPKPPPPPPPRTILGPRTRVEGDLVCKRDVELWGRHTGRISTEGTFAVARSGKLEGPATCACLTLEGEVRGDLAVSGRAAFLAGSSWAGVLSCGRLVVQSGARLVGTFRSRTP